MYAKLIDGNLEYAPRYLLINGQHVFTNDAEIYLSQGYKSVSLTDAVEQEGYSSVPGWTETDTEITRTWSLEPIPEQEDLGEVIDILTGDAK